MDAVLTTGLFALAVASLVLGVARVSTRVLAIQRAFARVVGVIHAFDQSRPNLVNVQIQLLTPPTSSLALLGTAAHRLVTQFGANGRGWIFMASNLFRVFAVRELLQDLLLTLDGP